MPGIPGKRYQFTIGAKMYNFNPYGNQNNFVVSSGEPVWVQGKAGAQSYYVQPGKTAFLFDSEQQVFYIKTVNANGMPQPLQEFEYVKKEIQPAQAVQNDMSQYVTKDELKLILADYVNGGKNERPVSKVRKSNTESST